MRVRRYLTAGIWLATTVGATALVWTATSVVAGDVTDRPAPVLAQREVVQALQVDPPGDRTTTTVTTPRTPTSTVARSAAPTPPLVGPVQPPAPEAGAALPPPPPATSTTTASLPTANPTTPPTTARPVDPTATFSTAGGVVTSSCTGYFIRLVAATPTDGYAAEVLDRGPATVDVHFVGPAETEEIRVRLVCLGGGPIRVPDQHQRPGNMPGQP